MNKLTTIFIFLVIGTNIAYGNGGSIARGGFLQKCNTITLLNEKEFSLESEDLFFHIEEDYIYVTAIYIIKNRALKKNIKYGFAVDYRDRPNAKDYVWEEDYISGFSLLNNGKELKYSVKDEKNLEIDSVFYNKWDTEEQLDTVSRRWFISDLDFNELESKQLIVKYKVKTTFADWPLRTSYMHDYPSTPDSDRKFSYYLKPSGFWGDGKVGKFRLTISFDNIAKYSLFEIKGIDGFKKDRDFYVFECNNFDLLKSPFVKLNYNYSKWENSYNSRRFANYDLVDNFSSSSEHSKYPASNLFDQNKNTTYVPLKIVNNNWIKINFKENVVLFGAALLNGFTKNNESYANNNIATKIKVNLEFNIGEKTDSLVKIINLNRKLLSNDFNFYFTDIQDVLIGEFYGDVEGDNISDNMSSAKSLKIEILETDKGMKYDDTCISEFMLYGIIDKNR